MNNPPQQTHSGHPKQLLIVRFTYAAPKEKIKAIKKDFRSYHGGSSFGITTILFINVNSFKGSDKARFSPHETADEAKNGHYQCCFGNRRMSNRGVDVWEMSARINLFLHLRFFLPFHKSGGATSCFSFAPIR
jgi:hypothetical protein